jgi:hypothetical protein
LLKAFRQVLARTCNLTPEQVLGYSCHSPRQFLPEVARKGRDRNMPSRAWTLEGFSSAAGQADACDSSGSKTRNH